MTTTPRPDAGLTTVEIARLMDAAHYALIADQNEAFATPAALSPDATSRAAEAASEAALWRELDRRKLAASQAAIDDRLRPVSDMHVHEPPAAVSVARRAEPATAGLSAVAAGHFLKTKTAETPSIERTRPMTDSPDLADLLNRLDGWGSAAGRRTAQEAAAAIRRLAAARPVLAALRTSEGGRADDYEGPDNGMHDTEIDDTGADQ